MPARPISLTVRVITVLTNAPAPLKPCEVARKLNHPSNAVRAILGRLVDSNRAVAVPCPAGHLYWITRDDDLKIWHIWGVR